MGSFGSILKKRRLEVGLTLEELAKKTRSHKGYLSGMELGKVNPPSASLIRRIAKALNLDEVELALIGYIEKAPPLIRAELQRRVFGGGIHLES